MDAEANANRSAGADVVIPLIQEELQVHKELVETGAVRLRKIVHEIPEFVSEELASDRIQIERVPMDLIVDVAPPIRSEGDVTIISVVEEVLVFTKQLRLKEEIRVSKRRSLSEYRQEVRLRSEEVIVERVDGNTAKPVTEI